MPKRPARHLLLFTRWSCAIVALAILSVWVASLFVTIEHDPPGQDWCVTITPRTVSFCRFDTGYPLLRSEFNRDWIAEADQQLAWFKVQSFGGWSIHLSWWLLVPLLTLILPRSVRVGSEGPSPRDGDG